MVLGDNMIFNGKVLEIDGVVDYTISNEMNTEYRMGGRILLHVFPSGQCQISCGLGTNNVHYLQNRDLHKGRWKTPYFAYKAAVQFSNVEVAELYFKKWLLVRDENLEATKLMSVE
jgi:hypothetical protein